MEKKIKPSVKNPTKKKPSTKQVQKKDKMKNQSNSLENYFEKKDPENSLNPESPSVLTKTIDKKMYKSSKRTKKTEKSTNTLEKYVEFNKPVAKNQNIDENEFSDQENKVHNSSLIKEIIYKDGRRQLSQETKEKKDNIKLKRKNKCGIKIPTAAEIQKERDDIERCLKIIEVVESIQPAEELFKPDESTDEEIELLDCKHLTITQIDQYYKKYKQLIENIINGSIKSDRHKCFYENMYDKRSVTFNFSTYVFDFPQLHHLLNLMEKELSSTDETYIFYVLLPEICLKIFMDEHKMSIEDATVYLNKRPIV